MTDLFPPSPRPLSVFLVDDSTLVREKLVALVTSLPHIEISGEAADVPQAIATIAARRPDVVILDLSLPGGSGLDVLRAVKASAPATVVIILTMHPYRELGACSLEAGADFYFEKSIEIERLAAVLAVLGQCGQPRATAPAPAGTARIPAAPARQPADALQTSEELLRHLIGGSRDCIKILDLDGRLLWMNEGGQRAMEIDDFSICQHVIWMDFWQGPHRNAALAALAAARAQGAGTFTAPCPTTKGKLRWWEVVVTPILDVTGQPEKLLAVSRDITERKQAEAALRRSKDDYLQLFEQASDAIVITTADGLALDLNPHGCAMLGCTREAFVGRSITEFVVPAEHAQLWAGIRQLTTDAGQIREYHVRRGDGTVLLAEFSTKLLPDGRILGHARDVTARHQAKEALRASEERFRQIAETIQEVFWMTDMVKNQMIYVSPGYEKIWGRTCASLYAAPREWIESIYPEDRDRVLAAAMAKQVTGNYDETYRILRPNGAIRWIRDRAFPVQDADGIVRRIVGVAEDITERKKLEEQSLHTQRLESVGMLAAGITHDLNNILAPIGMASALLRNHVSESGDLRLLDTLEKCAERGAGLVRQILGFVHGVSGEPRIIQIKHLLRDIGEVITETFPKAIVLSEEMAGDLWPILANPTQIHQVFLNLCVNARDAMPQGGRLRLQAENCVFDEVSAAAIEGAEPGNWIVIQVADTGTGIPPEVLPRIWDPFYTTKAAGSGTGLGLPTVRGIVESHGGFITLETNPGRGTTFRVYLPAVEGSVAEATSNVTRSRPATPGRGELILFVDDEQPIRDVAATILTRNGYRVITACDGVEAIAHFATNAADIALIITDLDMPVLDGPALGAAIRRLDPKKKILAMSGLGSTSRLQKDRTKEFACGFLAKPFTVDALLVTIAPLLRGNAS